MHPRSILSKLKFWKIKRKRLIFLFIITISFVASYFFILKDIPSTATIGITSYPQSTKIYDRNGERLYTIFASKNQTFVPFEKIPDELKKATIAIEDKDFYKHGAIDLRGIARAFLANVLNQELQQGGSTITQQLVKNSLLTPERTITRKVREIILAFIVESVYTKDKILEMYLNQVSYGGTAWGVQAASLVYFDKSVDKLNLAESAFLAALPEAPSIYSPFGSRPELGKSRQLEVLKTMRDQEYITNAQKNEAGEHVLKFSKIQNKILAPHFVFFVKDLLTQKYGDRMVEQGGLEVVTSLDLPLQEYAQASVAAEIESLARLRVSNGAALITNPKTGEVLAMVGSRDYFDEEHDGNVNVTLARRQPGSSIKPINYAVGLIKGYTAATPFVDEKVCFPNPGHAPYCPVNYDGKFHGVVQMRYALANSYNIPAVKMLKANGVEAMVATASAMGITTFTDPSRYGLSLTLGGGEVTMLNMAEAFGVFANNGYRIPLRAILKVTDSKGKILEEYKPPKSTIFGEKVLPDGIAYIISHILLDNGARSQAFGTNSDLKIGNYPVSAKTGTTNDLRDNWTIGYTPSYVVAVWVGNNDNTPMAGVASGITGASPIWNSLMTKVLEGTEPELPQQPDSVVGRHVCTDTGQIAPPQDTPGRCPTRFEYFIRGKEDSRAKISREKVFIDKATGDLAKQGQLENIEELEKTIITDLTGARYCVDCPHPEFPSPTP